MSDAMESLYPFLYSDTSDLSAVLDQVRASTVAKTEEITEYLLPHTTNIRRVFVDNKTKPNTLWVGNNHGAAIVKVEPLD